MSLTPLARELLARFDRLEREIERLIEKNEGGFFQKTEKSDPPDTSNTI